MRSAAMYSDTNSIIPPKYLTLRFPVENLGWAFSIVVILAAFAELATADLDPRSILLGACELVAGLSVVPPVFAAIRNRVPYLQRKWTIPGAFVLLQVIVVLGGLAVEPHGAATRPLLDRAVADTPTSLDANETKRARSVLSKFESDVASNPSLKNLFDKIAAADGQQTQAAAAGPVDRTQAEFDRVNDQFRAATSLCETAVNIVGKAVQGGDKNAIYDVANRAKQSCLRAWERSGTTQFSALLPGLQRNKLNADLDNCSNAYLAQAKAMDQIAIIASGQYRPSTVYDANVAIQSGSARAEDCEVAYGEDGAAAGFTPPGETPNTTSHAR